MKLLSDIKIDVPYGTLWKWVNEKTVVCGTKVGKRTYYTEDDIKIIKSSPVYRIYQDKTKKVLN